MLCWGARYGLFILGYNTAALWPLYLGILLHGICYDFFFVTAYIYVDKKAPEAIRAKAQGFITFVMLGLGMFVGANLSGVVVEHYSFPNVVPDKVQAVADPGVWSPGSYVAWQANGETAFGKIMEIQRDACTAAIEVFHRADSKFEPGAEIVTQPLAALARPLPRWNSIWLLPALGAFAILTLFAILFRYREPTVQTVAPPA